MSETQSRLQISPDSSRRVSRLSHQSLEVCFCSALHLLCSRVLRVDIPDELLMMMMMMMTMMMMTTLLLAFWCTYQVSSAGGIAPPLIGAAAAAGALTPIEEPPASEETLYDCEHCRLFRGTFAVSSPPYS
jgi:hypothetical protein